jgi:hypothetical protein
MSAIQQMQMMGESSYPILEYAGGGGGRTPTLSDIQTTTGTLPVPGDVLIMTLFSVAQSHSPATGNPSVQLSSYSTSYEVEIWGCTVEQGQTTFAFNRGGETYDDYIWHFFKRVSGRSPVLTVVDSGGGLVSSNNINYSAPMPCLRLFSRQNNDGSGATGYDEFDNPLTGGVDYGRQGNGLLDSGWMVDKTGRGRLYEVQDGTYFDCDATVTL